MQIRRTGPSATMALAVLLNLSGCGSPPGPPAPPAPANEELAAHSNEFRRELIPVVDGVWVAVGFGLANSILIEGDDGIIIVDTMESRSEAETVLAAFRQVTDKPVAAVILTHNHADHINGAKVFTGGADIPVFAHETTNDYIDRLINVTNDAIYRRSMRMFGQFLPDGDVLNAGIGPSLAFHPDQIALARPNRVFADSLDIEIAGVRVELVHAPGETPDQLFVWLPDLGVLLPGDNVYRAFPNLYTIRGTPYRDVMDWVRSLDAMRSRAPAIIVPSHTRPIIGAKLCEEVLRNYRDAIQYVHDQTLRGMNQGLTPQDIVQTVHLPDHLADFPWLREYYGTVRWSVQSIFDGYLGWFGGDAAYLDRLPPAERAARFADALERGAPLIDQTRAAVAARDWLWASELSAHLIRLNPRSNDARELQARVFDALGQSTMNANARHYYLSQARERRGELSIAPMARDRLSADFVREMDIGRFMHALPVRLKAEKTLDRTSVVAFHFTDVDEHYTVEIRRGIADVREGRAANANQTITVAATTWKTIVLGQRSPAAAFAAGEIEVDGGVLSVVGFLNLFER